MDVKDIRKHVLEVLELPASSHDFELVDVALSGSTKNPTLTVYLDDNKGNSLESLSAANEWVEELLDAADIFTGSYILEISSPGINRHLRKLQDFERFVGQKAEVKVKAEKGERSVYKGVLRGIENQFILIETEKGIERISYESVQKAHLQVDIDFKSLKGTNENG